MSTREVANQQIVADLLSEVERLRRHAKVWEGRTRELAGEVLLRQSVSDAGWDRAEQAEATVARVEALLDRTDAGDNDLGMRVVPTLLVRAALHPEKGTDDD